LDYYRIVAQAVAEEVSFSGGAAIQRTRLQVNAVKNNTVFQKYYFMGGD